MGQDLKARAISGTLWSFVERFAVQFAQFLITIVMARLLTPADYGLIGMLSIFISLSQIFIDGGFSSALIQSRDKEEKDYSTVFYINIAVSVLLYLILFFTAPLISSFYRQPTLTIIVRVYAINLIINSVPGVIRTILTIKLDFKTQSKISLSAALLSGCGGIICAAAGLGVWALVVQSITLALFNTIFSFLWVKWRPMLEFSTESFRKLFSFGSKLLVAQIISSVYNNIYNLVIGRKFSSTQLGYYTRADSFTAIATSNISGVLTRVSFPLLSEFQEDNAMLLKVYSKYISISAFIMFPVSMLLCGIARPLILFLLTDKWAGCILVLQILCVATLWQGIVSINLNLLNVKGRSDLVLKLEMLKKGVAFAILGISVLFNDFIIVCLGLVVYSVVAFYMNTIYTKRLLDYGFIRQMKTIWPYLAISAIILVESLAASHFITDPLLSITVSITVCTATYLLICKAAKLYAYHETVSLLRPCLKRILPSSRQ